VFNWKITFKLVLTQNLRDMRMLLVLLIGMSTMQVSFGQEIEGLPENPTLKERFLYIKSKSQSYGAYKVVKETTLDGVWKIAQDTIAAKEASIQRAQQNINKLKGELANSIQALKDKEKSMEQIQHASTHINVIGIDFNKGTFITTVAIIIASLLVLLGLFFGRMKLQSNSLSERNLAVSALTHEFEEYKQRAMERQTKLSRELQDERNKLHSRNP
jgi:hypothetical protein